MRNHEAGRDMTEGTGCAIRAEEMLEKFMKRMLRSSVLATDASVSRSSDSCYARPELLPTFHCSGSIEACRDPNLVTNQYIVFRVETKKRDQKARLCGFQWKDPRL